METFIDRKKMQLIAATVRKSCKTFTKRKDWFVRIKAPITPCQALRMKTWLKDELLKFEAESFQIALEGTNETDYHFQMCVKTGKKEKDLRKWCKETYETMVGSFEEPLKNIRIASFYSCVRIRENALRAMAYNYKEDRSPIEHNISEQDIEIAKMLSHGKDLRQLSKKLEDLKERYFKNYILDFELTQRIILLKAEFNQNIYINRIEAMVRYIMIKKHPVYAKTWASQIVAKIKEGN
ncbi:MAG: putative replicase [Cressdnaviricota sp.]|nr:MAG: putative replicase [Cressdnaviricota sp.]